SSIDSRARRLAALYPRPKGSLTAVSTTELPAADPRVQPPPPPPY
ncbi:hypothetical protein Tco_0557856, partial [Tanacetum coccineum]